jgi:hypothetical protein
MPSRAGRVRRSRRPSGFQCDRCGKPWNRGAEPFGHACGVGVDAKPIDTRQLKQALEAATRCLQRNDWGTAFDRVQDALALLPDGVKENDRG